PAWCSGDRVSRRPLRRLYPEPRPGGEPGAVRPPRREPPPVGGAALGRASPPGAAAAAPVHGPGVRRDQSVSVLLQLPDARADRGRAPGAQGRVRLVRLERRGPRPARRGDPRPGRPELVVARPDPRWPAAAPSRPTPPAS